MTNSSLAFQMFHNGIGVSEIAKKINVSKTTVYKYIDLEMYGINGRTTAKRNGVAGNDSTRQDWGM